MFTRSEQKALDWSYFEHAIDRFQDLFLRQSRTGKLKPTLETTASIFQEGKYKENEGTKISGKKKSFLGLHFKVGSSLGKNIAAPVSKYRGQQQHEQNLCTKAATLQMTHIQRQHNCRGQPST
ncbi:hypothetical protein MKW98_018521 [Papaver atlanticum]|uniref:Uncharacterized protein n=1 Tax=Papaver atlanticum TaxID=357466 RepID=A0AAD4XXA8_9MAGN|nr:hypothetical protein MKW98_018521 [Papaver atlanticum]